MADPFAAGLRSLFHSAASAMAVYRPVGGTPIDVRIIRSAPDRTAAFGEGRIINESTIFELQTADVAEPAEGDAVVIGGLIVGDQIVGGEPFTLFGDPILDLERISWTCGAEPD